MAKLVLYFRRPRDLVVGNWGGEVSEDMHALLHAMANSRVRISRSAVDRKERPGSEEGESHGLLAEDSGGGSHQSPALIDDRQGGGLRAWNC